MTGSGYPSLDAQRAEQQSSNGAFESKLELECHLLDVEGAANMLSFIAESMLHQTLDAECIAWLAGQLHDSCSDMRETLFPNEKGK